MAEAWENLPDVKPDDWEKLPDVKAPPAGKVPSPTGWREAGAAPTFRDKMAGLDQQNANMWGALASGAHGAANAMEGPINGLIAGATTPPLTERGPATWDDIMGRYRAERDRIEGAQKQNLKEFPRAPIVGAMLAGGAGQAPSRLGRLAMGGLQGAVYGAGSSPADLTKGEVDPLLRDTGKGALIGAGGAAAGEVLNAGASALGNKLSGVLGKNREAAQAAADKLARSSISAHGGDVSAGSNQLKMLREALTNENVEPELKRAAEEFLASEEGKALLNQVLRSNLGRAEGQVGRMAGSREAMLEALANAEAPAVDAAAQARLNDPSALLRRVREMGPKVVLPAVGGALAGPPGAAAGALTGAMLGRSGTTVRNALADPYVASRLLGAGSTGLASGGMAMSKAAPPLAEWAKFLGPEEEQP